MPKIEKRFDFFFSLRDCVVAPTIMQLTPMQYTKQLIIALHEVSISAVNDTEAYANAWSISSPKRSFILTAGNEREKSAWVDHLSRVCGGEQTAGTGELLIVCISYR